MPMILSLDVENSIQFPYEMKTKDVKPLRDKLIKEQNNKCPICARELTNPVLDHSHKKKIKGTGLVRGVICSTCNIFLGKIENNCARYKIDINELPNVLRNMANYLEKEHLPYVHPKEVERKVLKKSSYNKLISAIKKDMKSNKPNKTKIRRLPKYSKKLNKKLESLFKKYNIPPEFY